MAILINKLQPNKLAQSLIYSPGQPGNFTISETAKVLGTGERRLFEALRTLKILMGDNVPYQRHINNGNFILKVQNKQGFLVTLVTRKGLKYIKRRLKKLPVTPVAPIINNTNTNSLFNQLSQINKP